MTGQPVQYLQVTALKASPDTAKREVTGLALPYGEDLDRPDWLGRYDVQRFSVGSAKVRDNATFFYGHDHLSDGLPIGRITEATNTDDGLRITAKISDTPKGNEVYTLLKDGVLDRFSVGFYHVKNHIETENADTDQQLSALVHDEIDVFEVSVVPDPAYKSATVDAVLSNPKPDPQKETAMPDTPTIPVNVDLATLAKADDVATLSTAVEDLGRKIATLGSGSAADDGRKAPAASYGEFLKKVAAGDKDATDFLAYAGGVIGDLDGYVKDAWVGERYKLVNAQRTTLNLFARSPLPADGMGIEYGVLDTDTTQVGQQAAEGDVLPYGKVTWSTERAPIGTFGGWGEMSRQQIERSSIPVVERFFDFLINKYSAVTESAVATYLAAAGTPAPGGVLDMTTVDGWTRFAIRAAKQLKDTGYPLEFIAVSFDVFENLAVMLEASNNARFLNRDNGNVNITGISADMFGVPVVPFSVTGIGATDTIRACNSQAIRSYEASGAPFRLQDGDITNLTNAYSIYGYMAVATEVPAAIVAPATV